VVFESAIAASSLSWSRVQPEVVRFTSVCAYDRAGARLERCIDGSPHARPYR
jgi:hypothetical protein